MKRRRFSREFKLEAVKLVRERGLSAAQAARDLDVHENVLRKWVKEFGSDPVQAFPGHGQMKPEQQEIERLRREVNKLKAERDILKKAAAFFAREATRCKACSAVRRYAFKRSQLIALRLNKITAESPASNMRPRDRD